MDQARKRRQEATEEKTPAAIEDSEDEDFTTREPKTKAPETTKKKKPKPTTKYVAPTEPETEAPTQAPETEAPTEPDQEGPQGLDE